MRGVWVSNRHAPRPLRRHRARRVGAMRSVRRAHEPRPCREAAIKRVRAVGEIRPRSVGCCARHRRWPSSIMRTWSRSTTSTQATTTSTSHGARPPGTLQQRLAAHPRTLAEILDVMRRVGEGLAANKAQGPTAVASSARGSRPGARGGPTWALGRPGRPLAVDDRQAGRGRALAHGHGDNEVDLRASCRPNW